MLAYKQTTYETCLACSLLLSVGKIPTKQEEFRIINHSLRFSKESFALGHLDYFVKKYNKRINFFVESAALVKSWGKIQYNSNILMKMDQVNENLINRLLKTGPVICYIDNFVLQKKVHYPHYVVMLEKVEDKYNISDPWDGKIKIIDTSIILKGIKMLKNHLLFSPQLIQIEQ